MNLYNSQAVTGTLTANGINTAFLFTLMPCQELALAINLQRKYAVLLETCQHGIFCQTWLAHRNAQHESHQKFECYYSHPETALREIRAIHRHLNSLLDDSKGGAV